VSGRAETQTAASILGSALESVIEILSVALSSLGASSPFGSNRRTPSVGENMMETFMPRFVADDRAGRKRFSSLVRTFSAIPGAFFFCKK
jgi:hypothetical protein